MRVFHWKNACNGPEELNLEPGDDLTCGPVPAGELSIYRSITNPRDLLFDVNPGIDERAATIAYLRGQAEAFRHVPWLGALVSGLADDIEAGKHHR